MSNSDIAEPLSDRLEESKASSLHGVDQVIEPASDATAKHIEIPVAGAKALVSRYQPVRTALSSTDPPLVASILPILRLTTRLDEPANNKNAQKHFSSGYAVTTAVVGFNSAISRNFLMLPIYECSQIEAIRLSPAINIQLFPCERLP